MCSSSASRARVLQMPVSGGVGQQRDAFVAQHADADPADLFDQSTADGGGFETRTYLRGLAQPDVGFLEIARQRRFLGVTQHCAFHRGHALRRTRLAGCDPQHFAEQRQCGVFAAIQPVCGERAFSRFVDRPQPVGARHAVQECRTVFETARTEAAHHRRDLMRAVHRLGIVAGLLQRGIALALQPAQRAIQTRASRRVGGVAIEQREIERDGRVCILEQPALGQRGLGATMRLRRRDAVEQRLRRRPHRFDRRRLQIRHHRNVLRRQRAGHGRRRTRRGIASAGGEQGACEREDVRARARLRARSAIRQPVAACVHIRLRHGPINTVTARR